MDDAEANPPLLALTGATGFIGQQLQRQLLADGFRLRVLLRPGSPRSNNILAGVQAVQVHLHDQTGLADAVRGTDAVVYCAGSVRGRSTADFAAANVDGVGCLASVLSRLKIPLLLISSLAASRPEVSDYAASKAEGERQLRAHPDLAWTILRPPAVYGPGDKEMRPILAWVRRGIAFVAGPPGQRLSLLYSEDLAAAVAAWWRSEAACRHQVFEIDDGQPGGYDWMQIAEAVGRGRVHQIHVHTTLLKVVAQINWILSGILGYSPMLTPGKVRELTQDAWVCDNAAFTRITGWAPTIRLREGARRIFDGSGRN
ncbi:MAG: NAD-dependent epimerase/dehydratase family protein [Gammaproteobacteria bacterium]